MPFTRIPVGIVLALLASCAGRDEGFEPTTTDTMQPSESPKKASASDQPAGGAAFEVVKSDDEWRHELSSEQYRVLRQAGTERPFGDTYEEFHEHGAGTYHCAGCGAELFSSNEKFDSRCGWPSFYDPSKAKNVITKSDRSGGVLRTEVLCARCGGHLGHVFTGEGFPTPTDKRYCINGVALEFVPAPTEKGK